jgi:hypothetical protein
MFPASTLVPASWTGLGQPARQRRQAVHDDVGAGPQQRVLWGTNESDDERISLARRVDTVLASLDPLA